MLFKFRRRDWEASPGFDGPYRQAGSFKRTTVMTIEIMYLTTRIHQWLNVRVARHLAAQASKFAR